MSIGLVGAAVRRGAGGTASTASSAARTASRNASAILTGSSAAATAVFARTASAPSSIASAACDGRPMPASTTTGTRLCSTMISIMSRVRSPRFEPMGEPSGITAAAPASSQWRASTGSALMYGRTTIPIRAHASTAFSVSTGSGSR